MTNTLHNPPSSSSSNSLNSIMEYGIETFSESLDSLDIYSINSRNQSQ